MRKFSKGDKVRFIGNRGDFNDFVTNGSVYEINHVDSDGDANFYDDRGDGSSCSYISERNERLFEMVDEETPVEASPTVIELLANLSRRLYEAEKEITELNEKQAVFFDIDTLMKDRIFDLERQSRVQAYEINELYKAVADRG